MSAVTFGSVVIKTLVSSRGIFPRDGLRFKQELIPGRFNALLNGSPD